MKRIPVAAIVALALWLVTFLAPVVKAQGSEPAAGQQALDDDGLSALLSGLGYEPKKLSKGFLITVKKDTWTFYIQFVLSNDKSRLGMNAKLGSVNDPATVTADQWMNLLAQNNEIDPSSFNFDKKQKSLYMHRVLDNRALAPSYIRLQIENFCSNMVDTASYWKFVN